MEAFLHDVGFSCAIGVRNAVFRDQLDVPGQVEAHVCPRAFEGDDHPSFRIWRRPECRVGIPHRLELLGVSLSDATDCHGDYGNRREACESRGSKNSSGTRHEFRISSWPKVSTTFATVYWEKVKFLFALWILRLGPLEVTFLLIILASLIRLRSVFTQYLSNARAFSFDVF